jgi:UDP-galactopyranose mutase
MKEALIIGGGMAGVAAAIELSKKPGWKSTIVEKNSFLGAGLKTHYVGGHPCTFGPRHFLSHNAEVFEWLDKIVKLRLCAEHKFLSYVADDKQFYSYPIHEDDIPRMPESMLILSEISELDARFKDQEYKLTIGSPEAQIAAKDYRDFWLKSIGQTLYEKFIETYTKKMWVVDDERIIDDFSWSPKGVAIKKGSRDAWDTAISAYPLNLDGYDPVFTEAQKVSNILFNTTVESIKPETLEAKINGVYKTYDCIINTTPIDNLFENIYGELKYIGRTLTYTVLPVEYALPKEIYFTYYCGDEPYTRVTEYKKFTQYKSESTLISHEIPSNRGRYYPMPVKDERERAQKYFKLMNKNMFSIGRIGAYNYRYDIDDAIEQAINVVKALS